jgi:DUF4097 and DUF4098 domain-containing protein YvlB
MTSSVQTGVHEFACPGPIDVRLRVHHGDVIVTTHEQLTATVTIHGQDRDTAEHTVVGFDGTRLGVETPDGNWLSFKRHRVRVIVAVPHESTLTAYLDSADLRTEGRLGTVNATTGSGDIYVPETIGDLSAESGSGDLHLGRVGGLLRAHASSGDITATEVLGDAVIDVASGDVRLGPVRGALHARSASGDIKVSAVHGKEVGIDAASGDVTVGVPAGTSVWLDLSSVSGSTRNKLTPTGQPEGGAALSLRVHTISGDIQIQRAA